MKGMVPSRVIIVGVAIALLAACGGTQPSPGSIPAHIASRLGQSPALLYVANDEDGFYVVDYATGVVEQKIILSPAAEPTGACSGASGNVFMLGNGANKYSELVGQIYEYRHGGQTPVAVLSEPYMSPSACAVDPMSGNLAVTNGISETASNVAVYPQGQSPPTIYTDSAFSSYVGATYDNLGNLYVIGYHRHSNSLRMAELRNGGSALVNIALTHSIIGATCIQWDGSYLAITVFAYNKKTSARVYRISVSGSSAKIVQTVKFPDANGFYAGWVSLILTDRKRILFTLHEEQVGIFRYPAGGNRLRKILGLTGYRKTGLAFSR
jgi:hypothetical protein